jgi:hypothetical protein
MVFGVKPQIAAARPTPTRSGASISFSEQLPLISLCELIAIVAAANLFRPAEFLF